MVLCRLGFQQAEQVRHGARDDAQAVVVVNINVESIHRVQVALVVVLATTTAYVQIVT